MSEDSNEKLDGSDALLSEPQERIEKHDDRIAPRTPREAEGASDRAGAASASQGFAARRPPTAVLAAGVATAAFALVAVLVGAGFAAGWLGDAPPSEPVPMPRMSVDAASDDDQAYVEDVESAGGEAVEASSDSEGEPSGEKPASPDALKASDPSEPQEEGSTSSSDAAGSTGGGSAAPESASAPAAAPAPAPVPEPEPAPAPAPPAPSTVTVSVHVDSSRASSKGYPSSLGGGTVTLNQGASVYDALAATGVSIGGSSSYVTSIGGLAEFDCGPGSGWLYFVNGSSPGYGAGSYILNGGESISWIYTCDMGNDL